MRRFLLSLVSLLLAACSHSLPAPEPQRQESAVSLTHRCKNMHAGFSVSYPAGWKVNDGSVLPACSVFDPDRIELPRESEIPFDLSVVISAQEQPFDPAPQSSLFERVLSVQSLKVAGRDATRVEVEATGEGLADRGMRSLRYVVDFGRGRTLVATTNDAGDTYEQDKEALARMMQSLTFP